MVIYTVLSRVFITHDRPGMHAIRSRSQPESNFNLNAAIFRRRHTCTCIFFNNLIFWENNGKERKIVNNSKKQKFSAKSGKVGRSAL